jgi:hypothetical protein
MGKKMYGSAGLWFFSPSSLYGKSKKYKVPAHTKMYENSLKIEILRTGARSSTPCAGNECEKPRMHFFTIIFLKTKKIYEIIRM